MGLSYGEQSLCRVPPSPVHPHEGAPMLFYYNSFIFEAKSLICSLVGAFLWLSRGVASLWCQSLFSFLCCCKFTLFVSKLGKRVELVVFLISIHLKLFTAWIFWKPLIYLVIILERMNTSSLFHNPVLNFIKEVFLTAEVCYGTACLWRCGNWHPLVYLREN